MPQRVAQIDTFRGKQAGIKLAVGGQPDPAAFVTEGLRHRSDHSDLAAAIGEGPAFCHFAPVVGVDRLQGVVLPYRFQNFCRRHHIVHAPAVAGTDIHEFDEAQNNPRVAKVPDQRDDFALIHPAFDHHIDLDRRQPDALRCRDTFEHGGYRRLRIAHALKGFLAQCIEADGQTRQPGNLQRLCLPGQEQAIGGQGDFDGLVFAAAQPGQRRDQVFDAVSEQRLAAGQTNLVYAELHKNAGESHDLFEAQQLGARQKNKILAENFARHAVAAAQIAAVGNGYAQVAQGSLQGIGDERLWSVVIDHVEIPFSRREFDGTASRSAHCSNAATIIF